jgi:outer membrane protein assembly factor BamE
VIKESTETTVDIPKRDLDRTMWEKITGVFGSEDSSKPAAKPKTVVDESLPE